MSLTPLKKALVQYESSLKEAKASGGAALDILVEALRPILPDLEASMGWAEAGMDTLCFWSETHDVGTLGSPWTDDRVELVDVLREVMEDAGLYVDIDTPNGIYLTQQEAQQIREVVRALLGA